MLLVVHDFVKVIFNNRAEANFDKNNFDKKNFDREEGRELTTTLYVYETNLILFEGANFDIF